MSPLPAPSPRSGRPAGRCPWVTVDLSGYLAAGSGPMAADEEGKKQAASQLVQVVKTMQKALPSPAVLAVSLWELFTACVFAVSFLFAEAVDIPCGEPSWLLPCIEMTDAAAATAEAIYHGMQWCAAAQAAAAALALALALLLQDRRSCRALAYAALAGAAAGHYLYASLTCLLLDADPGYLLLRISGAVGILFYAAGDLVCLLALLLGEDD